jgi:O-acetyl-ADP-ribose deacetylase (regulator of RNase III)
MTGNTQTLQIFGDIRNYAHEYDIIIQGCNCFCVQGAGLAKTFSETYGTSNPNTYELEAKEFVGNNWKLGNYQGKYINIKGKEVLVVNAYTQYKPGPDAKLWAIQSIMYKLNLKHAGKSILIPEIGCGIGGLNWDEVKAVIIQELTDMSITFIKYQ